MTQASAMISGARAASRRSLLAMYASGRPGVAKDPGSAHTQPRHVEHGSPENAQIEERFATYMALSTWSGLRIDFAKSSQSWRIGESSARMKSANRILRVRRNKRGHQSRILPPRRLCGGPLIRPEQITFVRRASTQSPRSELRRLALIPHSERWAWPPMSNARNNP